MLFRSLILEEIEKYLKDNGKLEEDAASQSMPSGEEETLEIDILNDLKDVLNRMDLKACGSILEQMSTTNYGINDNKEINKLKDAFEHFDFHNAKKVLNGLIENGELTK